MPKKCIICGSDAKYVIKGTSDYYCEECAEENFSDITLLEKVDESKRAEEEAEDSDEGDEDEDADKLRKKPEIEPDDEDSDFDDDDEAGNEEE